MSNIASVYDRSITVSRALRRNIAHEKGFLDDVVDVLLVREFAARNGITVGDEELQLAADEMRYQRGLEQLDTLRQWMKANHQTAESLQEGIEDMLLRNKCRNSIPESTIQAYFADHQLEFESVDLYSIRIDSESTARELKAQIREEGPNFYQLAMDHSQDEDTRHVAGFAGRLTRGQMTGEIEAAVFKAKAGDVVGPIKTEKGWNLFKVAAIHPANFEAEKENLRLRLFDEAMAKLKAEAEIHYPCLEEDKSDVEGFL